MICHTHDLESISSRGVDKVGAMDFERNDCDCDLRRGRKDGELDL
jgi:hypothetical protein